MMTVSLWTSWKVFRIAQVNTVGLREKLAISPRDAALDGLRALAILRVITWHTSGWAWTTWIISSVPAMFVVTGALLARSLQKASAFHTLRKRFKRLFLPLWFYSLTVYLLSLLFEVRTSAVWTFFFPFSQPSSLIASQWFTSAMWYLRAYVWVLVLAPFIYALTRRFKSLIPVVGIIAVIALGIWDIDSTGFGWAVGDIVLYSTCTAAGMAWLVDGRPSPRSLHVTAFAFLAGVCGWLLFRQPIDGVVNNDHVLHLFVGGFWTALLLHFPMTLSTFSTTAVSRFLNRYPLSIYLWHSMTAWFFWQLVPNAIPTNARVLLIVALTFLALPVVTYLIGLFEHRKEGWFTLLHVSPRIILVLAILLAINVGPLSRSIDFVRTPLNQPLPPSAAPTVVKIEIEDDVKKFLDSSAFKDDTWSVRETEMQSILDKRTQEMGLGKARAIVATRDGPIWHGISGNMRTFDQPSLIGSLTKTFTTTLVMQLVDEGLISLDDPVGDMGMGFKHGQITIRQLLTHTSGLSKYKTKSGYVAKGTTPMDVLRYVSEQPLRNPPGSYVDYSTSGFSLLGFILEQKTGKTFEELLRSRITDELGYDISTFRGDYGSIGFSTGGIIMTMDDLADWTRRYFFDRSTTKETWDWAMRTTTGVGTHGYCPCRNKSFLALGHIGGRTFASVDGDGTVVIIDTTGILVLDNYKKTQTFAQELRLVAGGGKKYLYP
jgi:CubicO group peptidase (beta-lactamase class C family)/peptidoglycan/LPS O-acetylase OafA/YrhL